MLSLVKQAGNAISNVLGGSKPRRKRTSSKKITKSQWKKQVSPTLQKVKKKAYKAGYRSGSRKKK